MSEENESSGCLVAIDWGSSSLRGALLDADGRVIRAQSHAKGVLHVSSPDFPKVFDELFGNWMRLRHIVCLVSGMGGSRQGWQEAPYCGCPASLADLAGGIIDVECGRIAIVPGIHTEGGADGGMRSEVSMSDVMRGEEVQVFGAMALTGLRDALVILPGTHCKWVDVRNGRIVDFRTFMTGEFYALLRKHSILSYGLTTGGEFCEAAFLQGVDQARNERGLLHNAFMVRTQALFDRMPGSALPSYLSGLLVGEELRAQGASFGGLPVVLVGAAGLVDHYAIALRARGIEAIALGSEATWAGLHALACLHYEDLRR